MKFFFSVFLFFFPFVLGQCPSFSPMTTLPATTSIRLSPPHYEHIPVPLLVPSFGKVIMTLLQTNHPCATNILSFCEPHMQPWSLFDRLPRVLFLFKHTVISLMKTLATSCPIPFRTPWNLTHENPCYLASYSFSNTL